MALLAERELDHALGVYVLFAVHVIVCGDALVVDRDGAVADGAIDLAVRFGKAGGDESGLYLDAGGDMRARRRRSAASRPSVPSSKVLRAVSAAASAAARPCTMAVASLASTFLASLISWPFSAASLAISSSGSTVNNLREARDVAIFGVAPVLPIVVRAHQIAIEPDRAGRGLAHLGAGGGW